MTDQQKELIRAAETLSAAFGNASTQSRKFDGSLQLTQAQVNDLVNADNRLADSLVILEGKYYLTKDAIDSLTSASITSAKQLIVDDGRIAASSKERAAEVLKSLQAELLARKAVAQAVMTSTGFTTREITDEAERAKAIERVVAANKEVIAYQEAMTELSRAINKSEKEGYYVPEGTGTGGGGSTRTQREETITDIALQKFQSDYKDLQHLRDLDEIDEAQYYDRLEVLKQDYYKDAKEQLKDYNLTKEKLAEEEKKIDQNMYQYEKEIYDGRAKLVDKYVSDAKKGAEEIRKAYQDVLQGQIDSLSDQQRAYQALFTMGADVANDRIKALQAELDALEEQNDAIEDNIRLQELQDRLAQAKSRKIRVYKNGRFQYISDIDEVASAQADIVDYQHQQLLDAEKKRINDQIKYWQEWGSQWGSAVSDYEKKQNELLVLEQFGISREDAMWDTRILNLQDFVWQYGNLVGQIGQYQAMLNQFSQIPDISAKDIDLSVDYFGQALKQAAAGDLQGALQSLEYRNVKVGLTGKDYGTSYEMALQKVMETFSQSTNKTYMTYGNYTLDALDMGNRLTTRIDDNLISGTKEMVYGISSTGGKIVAATDAMGNRVTTAVNTSAQNTSNAISNMSSTITSGISNMGSYLASAVIASNGYTGTGALVSTATSTYGNATVSGKYTGPSVNLSDYPEWDRQATSYSGLNAQGYAAGVTQSGEIVSIKHTSDAGGGSQSSVKLVSGERRTDLAGQTVQVGNTVTTYDDLGYRVSTTYNRKATGTTNAREGLTLLGEQGPELGVLNNGDGVIPANLTENLWKWGRVSPAGLVSNLSAMFSGQRNANGNGGQVVTIQNLNLPSVKNGQEFVDYMRNNFWRSAVQFAT